MMFMYFSKIKEMWIIGGRNVLSEEPLFQFLRKMKKNHVEEETVSGITSTLGYKLYQYLGIWPFITALWREHFSK